MFIPQKSPCMNSFCKIQNYLKLKALLHCGWAHRLPNEWSLWLSHLLIVTISYYFFFKYYQWTSLAPPTKISLPTPNVMFTDKTSERLWECSSTIQSPLQWPMSKESALFRHFKLRIIEYPPHLIRLNETDGCNCQHKCTTMANANLWQPSKCHFILLLSYLNVQLCPPTFG